MDLGTFRIVGYDTDGEVCFSSYCFDEEMQSDICRALLLVPGVGRIDKFGLYGKVVKTVINDGSEFE